MIFYYFVCFRPFWVAHFLLINYNIFLLILVFSLGLIQLEVKDALLDFEIG